MNMDAAWLDLITEFLWLQQMERVSKRHHWIREDYHGQMLAVDAASLTYDLAVAARHAVPDLDERQQAIWAELLDRTLVAEVAW